MATRELAIAAENWIESSGVDSWQMIFLNKERKSKLVKFVGGALDDGNIDNEV
jgi:hypothetical protein